MNPWDEDTTNYSHAEMNARFWRCWAHESLPRLRAAWEKVYADPNRKQELATLMRNQLTQE